MIKKERKTNNNGSESQEADVLELFNDGIRLRSTHFNIKELAELSKELLANDLIKNYLELTKKNCKKRRMTGVG